jgi:hypothetical protein
LRDYRRRTERWCLRSVFASNALLHDRQNCIGLQKNTIGPRFFLAGFGRVRLSLAALQRRKRAGAQHSGNVVHSNLFCAIEFCNCAAVNLAAFPGAFGAFVAAVCSIRKTDNPAR